MRDWEPLLPRSAATRALEIASAIARTVNDPRCSPMCGNCSLSAGTAGAAVLHRYLALASGDDITASHGDALLDSAAQGMAREVMSEPLFSGFCGVAWAVDHLCCDGDATGTDEEITDAVLDLVSSSPWTGEYDLVSGLAGLAVYAAERHWQPRRQACLSAIVDRFAEMGLERDGAIALFTPPERMSPEERSRNPGGCLNLGLAHGIPCVVVALSAAAAAGVQPDRATAMCERALVGLLEHSLETDGFPGVISPGRRAVPARSAWCYGDAGVSAALYVAGKALHREAWCEIAIQIANRAAAVGIAASGVRDAALCHGAAGLGLIFHRLYHETHLPAFADAARRWYNHTLELQHGTDGIAGYQAWTASGWVDKAGLLQGAVGVGLGLLAASTPIEPSWDRILMLSLPTTSRRLPSAA